MRYEFENLHKISKNDFLKLDEKDILFITHPGRMGDEDGTTFIMKNGNDYIAYRVSGWMYGNRDNPEFISYQDTLKQFPVFKKELHDKDDEGEYKQINMGFGNRLFVKMDIYPEYDKYLKEAIADYSSKYEEDLYDAGIIFNVWDEALVDMLKERNIRLI